MHGSIAISIATAGDIMVSKVTFWAAQEERKTILSEPINACSGDDPGLGKNTTLGNWRPALILVSVSCRRFWGLWHVLGVTLQIWGQRPGQKWGRSCGVAAPGRS